MSKFLSGRLRRLLVGITGYTENKTVVQTTGKVGIGTTDAQQHSLFVVGSTNITGDAIVGGGLTAVGISSFQDDVYIDNELYVAGVNVTGGANIGEDITTRNLKVTGISTVVGISTAESTLFAKELSVAGVSTFVGGIEIPDNISANFGVQGSETDVYHTGNTFYIENINNTASNALLNFEQSITLSTNGGAGLYLFTDQGTLESYVEVQYPDDNTLGDADTGAFQVDGGAGIAKNLTVGAGASVVGGFNVAGISTFQGDANFDDDIRLRSGNQSSIEFYDGNTYRGDLGQLSNNRVELRANLELHLSSNSDVKIKDKAWQTDRAIFRDNGAVELYYPAPYGSVTPGVPGVGIKRFETTGAGVTVFGTAFSNQLNISGVSTFHDDIHLGDNDVLNFGDGDDLRIYSDGTDSYISEQGTGLLSIDASYIRLRSGDGSKTTATFTHGTGSYGGVQLYWDNAKKFETTGIGVSISNGGTDTATIAGPENLIIDPAAVGDNTGIVRIKGDLYVDGTEFKVDSSTINLADLKVGIATNVSTSLLLDGGGIGIGDPDVAGLEKTLLWNHTNNRMEFNANLYAPNFYTGSIDADGDVNLDKNLNVVGTTTTGQLVVTGVATFQSHAKFGDGDRAIFGLHSDMEIYHSGSQNRIDTQNAPLRIDNSSTGIILWDDANTNNMAQFNTGGSVDLYHNGTKRLETTGIGVSIYNDLNVGTGVTIYGNAGIVSAISFYGDGSNLTNTGATLGATSGVERLVTTQLTSGTMVDAATDADLTFDAGNNTLNTENIKISGGISTDGADYGQQGQLLRSAPGGKWEWATVPGIFSVNNILNGFNVLEEGGTVGTAGSIHTLDFRGINVTASGDPQPNGIATITFSTTPTFDSVTVNDFIDLNGDLEVSGISTFSDDLIIQNSSLKVTNTSTSGNYLEAYQDNSGAFYLNKVGVGAFFIEGNNIYIGDDGSNETYAGFQKDGSSYLNHDGTKRLETTGYGVTVYNDLRVGTGVTIYGNSGIVSATAFYAQNFYGDGSNLTNTGASLSAATGTQRLVLTNLTSGTMVSASTDSDLTYDAISDKLNVSNIDITGITTLGGPVTAGSSEGVSGQYLRNVGTGVTWANFPTLRTSQTFTAIAGQTTFNFTYNVDFLDVYVNGVKLSPSEYTATSGSQVVLDIAAFAGDTVELYSYNTVSTYGSGGGGGGASALNGLSDVTIGTLADNQLLQYNSSNGQWENVSASSVVGSGSSFATKVSTATTATAGQTTFNGTYTVGFVDVYLNGAKLSEDQFTASSGTNIVLDEGASEDDIVEVVGLTANVSSGGGGGGGITEVLNDTTPQLGGNLDLNGKDITGTGSIDITGNLDVTGISTLSNVVVGGATTEMVVDGDLRVTGIITTGTGSVTINGNTNEIIVGAGVTIYGNTGIISATEVASHSLQFTDNNATVAGTAGTAGQFKQIGGAPFYYDGSAWRELVLLEGTPVTTPADTDWDSVMLRLDFEQDNFVIGDIENKKVWAGGLDQNPDLTVASGVDLVTSPVKFGSKSLRITNPGWQTFGWANRISGTSDRLFDVEGGWTMEGWIYITTLPSNQGTNSYSIFSNYEIVQNAPDTILLGLEWNGTGSAGTSGTFYNFYWKDGNNSNSNGTSGHRLHTVSGSFLLNTWNHIALVRDATDSSMHFYFNGTESQYTNGVSATFTDPDIQWAGPSSYFSLGGTYINVNDARTFDGVIDDFRFSNTSRYTANFTAPTSALPVTGTTSTTYTPPNSKQGEIALGASPTWTGTTGVTASQVGSGHYRLTFSSAYANTTAYTVTTNAMDYTPGTSLVGVGVTRVNSNTCDFIVSRVSDGVAVDTGSLAVNIYKK